MKRYLLVIFFLPLLAVGKSVISDEQIKQQIIQQSISSYPGNCPCPYSVARNGSSCGRRSAYSKPGGYDPICYPRDVTPGMVQDYRRKNGL
jgi:hypothetical protein